MDGGAGRNGPAKLKAAGPIVYDVRGPVQVDRHVDQLWHEAERKKAVRDRTAERTFLLTPLNVDVDPLVIACEFGQPVDHFLRHLDLCSEVPPLAGYPGIDRVDVCKRNGHQAIMPDSQIVRRTLPKHVWGQTPFVPCQDVVTACP